MWADPGFYGVYNSYSDDTISYEEEANVLLSQSTLVLSQGDTLVLSQEEDGGSMFVNAGSQQSIPYDLYTSFDMFENSVFSQEGDDILANMTLE